MTHNTPNPEALDEELGKKVEAIIENAEVVAQNDKSTFADMDNNLMNRQAIFNDVFDLVRSCHPSPPQEPDNTGTQLHNSQEPQERYYRGYATGQRQLITAIKSLLEESENRISIISILALLDRFEGQLEDLESKEENHE